MSGEALRPDDPTASTARALSRAPSELDERREATASASFRPAARRPVVDIPARADGPTAITVPAPARITPRLPSSFATAPNEVSRGEVLFRTEPPTNPDRSFRAPLPPRYPALTPGASATMIPAPFEGRAPFTDIVAVDFKCDRRWDSYAPSAAKKISRCVRQPSYPTMAPYATRRRQRAR
jgi:hypothetical protein